MLSTSSNLHMGGARAKVKQLHSIAVSVASLDERNEKLASACQHTMHQNSQGSRYGGQAYI